MEIFELFLKTKKIIRFSKFILVYFTLIITFLTQASQANENVDKQEQSGQIRDEKIVVDSNQFLTFKDWKLEQIREARESLQSPNSKSKYAKPDYPIQEISSSRSRIVLNKFKSKKDSKNNENVMGAAEKLQYAYDLKVEDYVSVYLVQADPDFNKLNNLVKSISSEELSLILVELLKKVKSGDLIPQNGIAMEVLSHGKPYQLGGSRVSN